MANHTDPEDDRPKHYGHYVAAIVVTGLFLFGAIAGVIAFAWFLFGHWWAIILAVGFPAFIITVLCDTSPGAKPVSVMSVPNNTDMIQGRVL